MKRFGLPGDGTGPYSDTTAVMKKTKSSVPMKSAKQAAGPRSCNRSNLPRMDETNGARS
jgi:hypothetical protein